MTVHPHGGNKNGYIVWKQYGTNAYGGVLCNLEDAPKGRQDQYEAASASRAKD